MRRIRLVLLLALGLAALVAALVAVGRWERARNASDQNARMAAVYRIATVQGLDSPLLGLYRLEYRFDCLLYHPADNPVAISDYELCFDPQGRLVQTIDRHTGTPRFASLLEEPSLATLRVPVPRLLQLFRTRGVFLDPRLAGVGPHPATLPTTSDPTYALPLPLRAPSAGQTGSP